VTNNATDAAGRAHSRRVRAVELFITEKRKEKEKKRKKKRKKRKESRKKWDSFEVEKRPPEELLIHGHK